MITCWSAKGGSGVSAVSALLALACSRFESTTLVDAAGDQPAIFGVPSPESGFSDWWAAGDAIDVDALTRLAVKLSPKLSLVGTGVSALNASSQARSQFGFDLEGVMIVDAGVDDGRNPYLGSLIEHSSMSLLVLRPCYLAVRKATLLDRRIDGLVVIDEVGRSLTSADLADVLHVPVVAQLPWDASIARSIDAGRVANRVPRAAKSLERLAERLVGEVDG